MSLKSPSGNQLRRRRPARQADSQRRADKVFDVFLPMPKSAMVKKNVDSLFPLFTKLKICNNGGKKWIKNEVS